MCKSKLVVASVVTFFGIWGSHGMGASVTFQDGLNGYQGTQDTILNGGLSNWDQLRNYGTSTELRAMGAPLAGGGFRTGSLIRFDNLFGSGSNQVPSTGVTINQATLRLYCTAISFPNDPDPNVFTIDTFLMKTPWAEGTKDGAYATGGEVTYMYKGWEDNGGHVTAYWGNLSQAEQGPVPGIDYDNTMNVWKSGLDINPGAWVDIDITNYVQAWQAGTTNNGVYATEITSYWKGAYFTSSEGAAAYRPQLVVEYVPEPASLILLALGGLLARRRK